MSSISLRTSAVDVRSLESYNLERGPDEREPLQDAWGQLGQT